MSKRRRLSREQRLEIIRDRKKGVSVQKLAARFEVTERTVYYTLRTEKDRKRDSSSRSETVTTTVTPEELAAFDAILSRKGIKYRADAIRRLMQSANGVFQPDEHLESELQSFRAALNRVGNNVTQISQSA